MHNGIPVLFDDNDRFIYLWILTFCVTMRNRRALNCGIVGVTPGILAGRE